MNELKWYTIQITPLDESKAPYNFKIETSLDNGLKKTINYFSKKIK